jgi:ADP-ribose pyrophosphatase
MMNDRPTILCEGKYLRFLRRGHWEYVTRRGVSGVVAIIAVTRDGKLLLVEQHRPPVEANVIELPAGLAGDGAHHHETMESAARRELLEETGYEAGTMAYVGGGTVSAGLTDELISLFLATDLNKTGPGLGEGGEQITLHEVPLDQLDTWLDQQAQLGKMADLKIYSVKHFLKRAGK